VLTVTGLAAATASASTTAGTAVGTPGPAQAAAHRLPDSGNPDGHASVPQAGAAVNTSHPDHVIGTGTPASCTSAALVKAVARGGIITFSGGGKCQILCMNTCDKKQQWTTSDCHDQQWPQLTVQNITLKNGNSQVRQTPSGQFGGGPASPCSPWAGSSRWSTPASSTTAATSPGRTSAAPRSARPRCRTRPGSRRSRWPGGSGGAIYTDGDTYKLKVVGTVICNNRAREGGGAIFYVSNNYTGWLTIKNSTLHDNPSAVFWTRPYPGIFFHSAGHPRVVNSTIN